MSGIPTKRPSKAWLQSQIAQGKSRTEIANACGSRNDTITRWCTHYDIEGVGRWNKPKDIECGKATVVALIVEDGKPEQFVIPGGRVVNQDEAIWAAGVMSILMGGRAIS